MAAQMNVDIGVMRSAQDRFNQGAATARNVLNQVQSVGGQLGGAWRGQAANTYQSTLIEWSAQAARVVAALEGLRDSLGGSITRLEQAEHEANQQSRI